MIHNPDIPNWQIPSHDRHKETALIEANIHPGQLRMLLYIANQPQFGFNDIAGVVRFCICYGLFAILRQPPHFITFQQAVQNIDRDEQFDSEVANLTATFHLYLNRGRPDVARRLIESWYGMASSDPDKYWRQRHLDKLQEPLQVLRSLQATEIQRPCKH